MHPLCCPLLVCLTTLVRFLTFDDADLALRFQNGPGHIGNGRYAGQPHFSLDFRFGQTVAPEIFFKQLSVTDDEPGLAIQHILHPRKKISHPTQEETPKGKGRSEEHTSELQSLMRNSYADFCMQKKKKITQQ